MRTTEVIRQCDNCRHGAIVATPRYDISFRVELFLHVVISSPNRTMQSAPSIPRFPILSDSQIVISATQWNQDALREVIISFTKMEQVADSMFNTIEEHIQTTSSRICSLEDASFIDLSNR